MQTSPETEPQKESPQSPPTRSRAWRIVIIVLALHAALLGSVVLIQGCGKSESPTLSEAISPEKGTEEKGPLKEPVAPNAEVATVAPNTDVLTPEEHLPNGETLLAPSPSLHAEASKADAGKPVTSEIKKGTKPEPAPVELKAALPAPSTPPGKTTKKYTVCKGDTLSKIAKSFKVSGRDLADMNKLSPKTVLKIGQKLTVPAGASTVVARKDSTVTERSSKSDLSSSGKSTESASPLARTHVVKAKETPISIARLYGVSVSRLIQANHITDPRKIHINQKLIVPSVKTVSEPKALSGQNEEDLRPTASQEPVTAGEEVKGI